MDTRGVQTQARTITIGRLPDSVQLVNICLVTSDARNVFIPQMLSRVFSCHPLVSTVR